MDSFNQFFSGTTLLAGLTYIGYQLRSVPGIIWGQIRKRLIYSVHIEQSSSLFDHLEKWLSVHREDSFRNVRAFLSTDFNGHGSMIEPINSEKRSSVINFEHYTDVFVLRYKGKRILVKKSREKLENPKDIYNVFHSQFRIESWLGKGAINSLLQEVLDFSVSIEETQQTLHISDPYGGWTRFGGIQGKDITNVFLAGKRDLVEDISNFILEEKWYFKRGLTYRRGYLLYGRPGNGKTSFCLAIAKHFKRDIYFLSLNDFEKDSQLFSCFSSMKSNSILVVEDVDAIIGLRNNNSTNISFSGLLNCLDGALSRYGTITIMTTNHIENIDPALIREGRIDVKVKVDNPQKSIIEEYLTLFFNESIKLPNYEPVFSMAQVQEICLKNKITPQNVIEILCNTRNSHT